MPNNGIYAILFSMNSLRRYSGAKNTRIIDTIIYADSVCDGKIGVVTNLDRKSAEEELKDMQVVLFLNQNLDCIMTL